MIRRRSLYMNISMTILCMSIGCTLNAMTSLLRKTNTIMHRISSSQCYHQKQSRRHTSTLYAPWRDTYSRGDGRHAASRKEAATHDECSLCRMQHPETHDHILMRGTYNFITLNQYPYNKGHIMVLPYKHIDALDKACPSSRQEAMELIAASAKILKDELRADGINVGINLGKAAGAGIPSHFHWHLVPRWVGDTIYITVLGNTTVLSTSLDALFAKLKPHFDSLNLKNTSD